MLFSNCLDIYIEGDVSDMKKARSPPNPSIYIILENKHTMLQSPPLTSPRHRSDSFQSDGPNPSKIHQPKHT